VDATLRGLDLEGAFDTVVSASEVANGKPAPDLYLAAAARLNIPPERCLAVEDTGPGIAAARAAGMFAVQLRAASAALHRSPRQTSCWITFAEFDLSLLSAEVRSSEPPLHLHRFSSKAIGRSYSGTAVCACGCRPAAILSRTKTP
jgi:beta-phosphoglucomutase-like phosphatase (HAD superfamily)